MQEDMLLLCLCLYIVKMFIRALISCLRFTLRTFVLVTLRISGLKVSAFKYTSNFPTFKEYKSLSRVYSILDVTDIRISSCFQCLYVDIHSYWSSSHDPDG